MSIVKRTYNLGHYTYKPMETISLKQEKSINQSVSIYTQTVGMKSLVQHNAKKINTVIYLRWDREYTEKGDERIGI